MAAQNWQVRTQHPAATLTVALMLLAAVLIQSVLIPVDADVSWLITVCERLLQGDRLYVDIVEANPPASVWIYLPLVWLSGEVGLRPEPVVIGFAMLGALLSIAATSTLAARIEQGRSSHWITGGVAFALLILPGGLFAQREHFAAMLAFPTLATIALLRMRQPAPWATLILAGASAGLMVVIKPPFALPLLLASAWAASHTRDWRPFVLPLLTAAAVMASYVLALLAFAPEYLQVVPMLRATYLPMHDRPINFLLGPMLVFPLGFYLLGRMLRVKRTPVLATALFLGSLGFALAGLAQGKNYLNHSYPGIALAVAAFAMLLGQRTATRRAERILPVVAAALLMLIQLNTTASVQPPAGLVDAIKIAGPASPTIMTLGTELATGHPATRLAGGRWVGSRPSLFTAAGARFAGLGDPEARRWYRVDLNSFVRDVALHKPDMILVEDAPAAWLLKDPAIRASMATYVPVKRAGATQVWRRR